MVAALAAKDPGRTAGRQQNRKIKTARAYPTSRPPAPRTSDPDVAVRASPHLYTKSSAAAMGCLDDPIDVRFRASAAPRRRSTPRLRPHSRDRQRQALDDWGLRPGPEGSPGVVRRENES